jgi:cytochrome c556
MTSIIARGSKSKVTVLLASATAAVCLALTGGAQAQSQGKASAESPYIPTATIKEIMDSMVAPTAQVLWDAVGVTVTEKGTVEKVPETDQEWATLRQNAVTLAEATNVLIIPGRHVDEPGAQTAAQTGELAPPQIEARIKMDRMAWIAHAHVLHVAAMQAIKAIDAKDVQGLTDVGGTIDEACETCHLQFWYPNQQ